MGREIGGAFLSKYLQKARDGADCNFLLLRRHSRKNKAAETMDKSTNAPMTAPTTASIGIAFVVDWVLPGTGVEVIRGTVLETDGVESDVVGLGVVGLDASGPDVVKRNAVTVGLDGADTGVPRILRCPLITENGSL